MDEAGWRKVCITSINYNTLPKKQPLLLFFSQCKSIWDFKHPSNETEISGVSPGSRRILCRLQRYLCMIYLYKQSSADTQSVSSVIGRHGYDHTQGCGTHLGGERGRKVCLRSSSLVLAWGQRCHCDSQVSQSGLENQAHKQITGMQRERERERRKEGRMGKREGWVTSLPHIVCCTERRLQGIAELVRWEFPQALLHGWRQMYESTHKQAGRQAGIHSQIQANDSKCGHILTHTPNRCSDVILTAANMTPKYQLRCWFLLRLHSNLHPQHV